MTSATTIPRTTMNGFSVMSSLMGPQYSMGADRRHGNRESSGIPGPMVWRTLSSVRGVAVCTVAVRVPFRAE
jgi:hypothetical protein